MQEIRFGRSSAHENLVFPSFLSVKPLFLLCEFISQQNYPTLFLATLHSEGEPIRCGDWHESTNLDHVAQLFWCPGRKAQQRDEAARTRGAGHIPIQ